MGRFRRRGERKTGVTSDNSFEASKSIVKLVAVPSRGS